MKDEVLTDVEDLTSIFSELSLYYNISGDKNRAYAFEKVSDVLRAYPGDTITGKEAAQYKDIGKSSIEIIDEYNSTGKVTRLENFRNSNLKDIAVYVKEYTKIYGIGLEKALGLYNRGIRDFDTMLTKGGLTEMQKLSLLWYPQYSQPIYRIEMDYILSKIKKVMDNISTHFLGGEKIVFELAGSYRRGEATSGDIDLLILHNTNLLNMELIVETMHEYLKVNLKEGEIIYHGIFRLSNLFNGHRIDILLVEPEDWYTSLLHFTGSRRFNILMSKRAIDIGARLSRKGLFFGDEKIPMKSEEDIFETMGVMYLPPNKRGKDLQTLTLI